MERKISNRFRRMNRLTPKFRYRFVIAILGVLACILLCSTQYNLSIAIVSMVEDFCTPSNSVCPSDQTVMEAIRNQTQSKRLNETLANKYPCSMPRKFHRLDWSESRQGFSLGSYYFGFATTNIFGGRLAERYGSKWVAAFGLSMAAIFNALLPLAASFDFILFVSLR